MTAFLKNQNFAFSNLASPTASGATSLSVTLSQGARFPATGNFMCVLWSQFLSTPAQDPDREIIEVTARSTDAFTIVREQEGTAGKAWSTGDNIALVITAGKVTELETAINLRYASGDSPSFAAITDIGLTASLPVVTDASKNLASVTYATFKSSLSLAQADISGLTTGSTVTHVGLLLTGLTISNAVVTDGSKNLASVTYTGATSLRANLSLETTHSPTFAGLTVGSLSGIIKAAAGVLGIVSIGTSLSYSSSTLDAAQNISVSGSPQFINLKLTGLSGTGVRYITTDAAGNLGVGAGIFYNTTFINADLVAGILTVTHNLTVAYGVVIIINNSGKVVIPDQIDFSAASTSYFTVDLISYGALTGTWRVVFLPAGGTVTPTMSSPDYIGMEVFLDG